MLCYAMLCYARPLEMLAALVAAVVHDVGHDGRNNVFHNATNSELALKAAYQSPLERHHLATAFALIQDSGLLAPLPAADRREVREQIVNMVLGTDFQFHSEILDNYKAMLEQRDLLAAVEGGAPAAALVGGEKQLALKVAIKTADLGNLSKGRAYTAAWTDRCLAEFFAQGDEEKARELPVSMGMDRHNYSRPNNQLNFLRCRRVPSRATPASRGPAVSRARPPAPRARSFMVQPLYEAMEKLVALTEQTANLAQRMDEYAAAAAEPAS